MEGRNNMIQVVKFNEIDFNTEGYWRVTITPQQAAQLLKRNVKNNRRLKRKKETYARDMRNGLWLIGTGETIKFNTRGELCDGQNRLTAVVLADVSVTVDIKTMVPEDAFKVLDSGVQRNDGDALTFAGVPNATAAAAISKMAQVLKNGGNNIGTHIGINVAPTRQEVVDFVLANRDEVQSWVRRCMNYQNRVKVAGMGATGWFVCFWLTECKDMALAEQFADQIENEDGIAAQTLLAAIQNPNGDGSAKSREWMVYKYVEAFNAINGGKYILSSDGTEVIKGYKKLFKDYCDNMRIQESTKASFNWDFK